MFEKVVGIHGQAVKLTNLVNESPVVNNEQQISQDSILGYLNKRTGLWESAGNSQEVLDGLRGDYPNNNDVYKKNFPGETEEAVRLIVQNNRREFSWGVSRYNAMNELINKNLVPDDPEYGKEGRPYTEIVHVGAGAELSLPLWDEEAFPGIKTIWVIEKDKKKYLEAQELLRKRKDTRIRLILGDAAEVELPTADPVAVKTDEGKKFVPGRRIIDCSNVFLFNKDEWLKKMMETQQRWTQPGDVVHAGEPLFDTWKAIALADSAAADVGFINGRYIPTVIDNWIKNGGYPADSGDRSIQKRLAKVTDAFAHVRTIQESDEKFRVGPTLDSVLSHHLFLTALQFARGSEVEALQKVLNDPENAFMGYLLSCAGNLKYMTKIVEPDTDNTIPVLRHDFFVRKSVMVGSA